MTGLQQEIAAVLHGAGLIDAEHEADLLIRAAATAPDGEVAARAMAARRASGVPLAYVMGRQLFMGIELITGEGMLVPRQETELLGQTALRVLASARQDAPCVVDMCCGSGNLACALAHHVPHARVWASDLTGACVEATRRNVVQLSLVDRVTVVQGDLFAGLASCGLTAAVDLIVCNPPYISHSKLSGESADLLVHEPREAFDGGPYGISIFQRVVKEALPFLRPGGALLFEVGLGQARQVTTLFERAKGYGDIRMVANTDGDVRVVAATRLSIKMGTGG